MMKVEIVLDEDKIRAEGEYRVEEIKRCTCSPFEKNTLRRVETTDGSIVYCDRGREDDFAWLWGANLALAKADWFVRYVKKWKWDDDFEGEDDILECYSRRKVGAFAK